MPKFALAFLDCEFGGLDPERHDITEIGVIVTDYRLAELASAEWKVLARPERITAEAAAIFGYDAERWAREGVPVRRALSELAALLPGGHTVIAAGQNVRMDLLFLEKGYRACQLPSPFDYHVIDLATLFYSWSLVAGEQLSALSLRQAASRAGLTRSGTEHHALEDARLTLETFRHFIGRLALRRPPEEGAAAPLPVAPLAAEPVGAVDPS
jgi:oligoribonuclease (3'-5' exoribonuclease)